MNFLNSEKVHRKCHLLPSPLLFVCDAGPQTGIIESLARRRSIHNQPQPKQSSKLPAINPSLRLLPNAVFASHRGRTSQDLRFALNLTGSVIGTSPCWCRCESNSSGLRYTWQCNGSAILFDGDGRSR